MELLTNESLCALAQSGDTAAQNQLIENNLPFIQKTANSILPQCNDGRIDADDLIQEGCLGLMEAVSRFDIEKGVQFLTYAAYWIKKFMYEAVSVFTADAERVPWSLDDKQSEIFQQSTDAYVKTPEQIVIEGEIYKQVRKELLAISARNRVYLFYRYGFTDGDEHSVSETAAYFGLTEKRARSTERSALSSLRRKLLA